MRKPRTRRLRKIENHLPDFLDSISSSLEIGNSLQQSIEIAVKNDRTPLGAYFKKILLKVKSGMTLDVSLEQQAQEIDGGSLSLAIRWQFDRVTISSSHSLQRAPNPA